MGCPTSSHLPALQTNRKPPLSSLSYTSPTTCVPLSAMGRRWWLTSLAFKSSEKVGFACSHLDDLHVFPQCAGVTKHVYRSMCMCEGAVCVCLACVGNERLWGKGKPALTVRSRHFWVGSPDISLSLGLIRRRVGQGGSRRGGRRIWMRVTSVIQIADYKCQTFV